MLEDESTPGPQCGRTDYVNGKIPVTPSGIEQATFRLVAQCSTNYCNSLSSIIPSTGLLLSGFSSRITSLSSLHPINAHFTIQGTTECEDFQTAVLTNWFKLVAF
jgi:hypothetical protein